MKILLIWGMCLAGSPLFGQTPEDSAKGTLFRFFDAMRKADTSLMRSTLSPTVVFQTIAPTGVRTEEIGRFLASVSKSSAGELDERITVETIKIDGSLAAVWAPYTFIYKGKMLHCGVNSFQLVRQGVGWKIQYIIDTRRKSGCQTR